LNQSCAVCKHLYEGITKGDRVGWRDDDPIFAIHYRL
jgi:hypothetical protein